MSEKASFALPTAPSENRGALAQTAESVAAVSVTAIRGSCDSNYEAHELV